MKRPSDIKILIACEESQAVCIAFRVLGFEAYSCDLKPCSGGHPEWHLQMDAREALFLMKWDMVIAHPTCTRLTNSGVRWLEERDLWNELIEATGFFNIFRVFAMRTGIPTAIENPIPHKYAAACIGQYTQIIQPWQFGHGETKATCLWLYGLPELWPTNIVEGREQRIWKMGPSDNRAEERSKTYPGIAQAMAEQWGEFLTRRKA